jgi:DNA modification methylase
LLGADRADLIVTDPPYNTVINGHVSGLGSPRHREFVMASGELSRREFQEFLSTACGHMAAFSRSGSLHYIFMDWRSLGDLLQVGEEVYGPLLNLIVWAKTSGGMGSMYRSRHELVLLFKRGKRAHKNRVQLGASGRYRTNVWDYPGANSFSATRKADLDAHPTVKNLNMIVDAIKDASDRHDIVLDPFGGSGTTLIAAERCGRRARLIELDPHYCDTILNRSMEEGLDVRLSSSGQGFDEIRALRSDLAAREPSHVG